jgi:hypothetical protein
MRWRLHEVYANPLRAQTAPLPLPYRWGIDTASGGNKYRLEEP